MKKLFLAATAAAALTACTNDLTDHAATTADEQTLSFSVAIPDMMSTTRAAAASTNSARGGVTNVDTEAYDLRYQLAVYSMPDNELILRAPIQTKDAYEPTSFEVRLTPNRQYRVVAWADFVAEGTQEDLHYDTSDFSTVTLRADDPTELNDESRDAFFVSQTIEVGSSAFSTSLTLRRPFAKLRIVTTDWHLYGHALEMPDKVVIGYQNCVRYGGVNLLTGQAIDAATLGSATDATTFSANLPDAKSYALGYDASENNRTLLVDYLMADNVNEHKAIHFTFTTLRGDTIVTSHDVTTDIPTRRNWLTTLIGNMLATEAAFDVMIDEDFDDETVTDNLGRYFYGNSPLYTDANGNALPGYTKAASVMPALVDGNYQIRTAAELAWIADNEEQVAREGHNILLMNDVDLRHIYWSPVNLCSKEGLAINPAQTFDGQGFTIKNLTLEGETDNAGLFGNSEITIKNLTLENVYFYDTALSAGALAGSHQNGTVSNCHAKHVFIRNGGYIETAAPSDETDYHPMGGLFGHVNACTVSACSAYDVDLQNSSSVGVLAGQATDVRFDDCSAEKSSVWVVRYIPLQSYMSLPEHLGHSHDGLTCSSAPALSFGYWYGWGGTLTWHEMSNLGGSLVGSYEYTAAYGLTAAQQSFAGCTFADVTFKYADHQDLDNLRQFTLASPADFSADFGLYEWANLQADGTLAAIQTYKFGPLHSLYGTMEMVTK